MFSARTALISDIHGNLAGLLAVLRDAEQQGKGQELHVQAPQRTVPAVPRKHPLRYGTAVVAW